MIDASCSYGALQSPEGPSSGEYARARQRPSAAERQAIILRDDVGGFLI